MSDKRHLITRIPHSLDMKLNILSSIIALKCSMVINKYFETHIQYITRGKGTPSPPPQKKVYLFILFIFYQIQNTKENYNGTEGFD